MRRSFAMAALAAALGTSGISVHASCVDPRPGIQTAAVHTPYVVMHQAASEERSNGNAFAGDIVGTWHVTYTSGGQPFADAFIQWHSDHTEWENINRPVLGGNICMGSWKVLDARHVFRNHYGWLFTDGALTGYFNETETDELSKDGKSYTGTNETKIYDLDGNLQADIPGAASAIRISP